MGKRSDFERKPRDFYPTPLAAVEPLIDHLPKKFTFAEPCAGDGQLFKHLEKFGGTCMWASDIEPQMRGIAKNDYSKVGDYEVYDCDFIITNPPWDRKILHPMIEHFTKLRPTWLLFDADWMHTKQASEYIKYCSVIVSVGRIKWFGNMTGKDNCAWYRFEATKNYSTIFHGRT
tara:strand:- start:459 stop:980 length:522 start_codon:yes stop_codon:yes gene_type:complete